MNATHTISGAHANPDIGRRRLLLGGLATLSTAGAASVLRPPAAHAAGIGNVLPVGQQLNPGDRITSPYGRYFFIQQDDGNAVLYTAAGVPLWTTRSNGLRGAYFVNQEDGNLVCYTPGYNPAYAWASGTDGRGAGDLVIQDDGNLVRYGGPAGWAWASGTDGGRSNLASTTGVLAPFAAPTPGPAVNPKIEAAIVWYTSRTGLASYEGKCELAAELAYGTSGRYASAIKNWYDRQAKKQAHSDWANAPRGSLVFYNTSADGHVAISTGDKRIVSTSCYKKIGTAPIDFFQRPLGWALSPWV